MATEKRLIDAKALKDKFLYLRKMWSETEIVLTIDDAKIVDAVEVVRCENCKHWQLIHEHIPHMECQIFCGAYEHGYPTNADDFCSYGERS